MTVEQKYPSIPARHQFHIPNAITSDAPRHVDENFRHIERWGNALPFNGFIVTSTTRPAAVTGTIIYETDTGLLKVYDGSAWTTFGPPTSIATTIIPTGTIVSFAGSAAPANWAMCDGSSQLRAGTYAALFAVIGTTYGSVDGTHFNLPDLRGRVAVGLDNMGGSDAGRLGVANTLGGSGGEENHTLTIAEMPAHTHPQAGQDLGTLYSAAGSPLMGWNANLGPGTPNDPTGSTGGGGSHNNMQPYILTNKIIKL